MEQICLYFSICAPLELYQRKVLVLATLRRGRNNRYLNNFLARMWSLKYSHANIYLITVAFRTHSIKITNPMTSLNKTSSWLDKSVFVDPAKIFRVENIIIVIILLMAVLSRFILLGERVMSHDEVNHVVPSYELYQGRGYRHDPVTHGPFQFHIVALSYFLFGDSDYSSRIPAALFSTIAVGFLIFAFRRYLGRSGAIIAGLLFTISPYMMFYGRYTRNEGFIEFFGVLLLYGILRYLEKGDKLSMFLVTIATVMHFCIKETSFIYTAQALIFIFVMFLIEARRAQIRHPKLFNRFILLMVLALLMVFLALGLSIVKAGGPNSKTEGDNTNVTLTATSAGGSVLDLSHLALYGEVIAVVGALALGAFGLFTLAGDIGWAEIKKLRSFTLLVLIGTLILPILSAIPITLVGWNPLDYSSFTSLTHTAIFVILCFIIAAVIGIWWNPLLWLQNAFVFYAIFTVFYTTFFTNGNGFFTGLVGSLGYWLSQQGVERGTQPKYYYALIQMPIYEFIGMMGTALAVYFGVKYHRFSQLAGKAPAEDALRKDEPSTLVPVEEIPVTGDEPDQAIAYLEKDSEPVENEASLDNRQVDFLYSTAQPIPVLALLLFWAATSLTAYSLAGERMPWLTVHITLPFLLAAAWGLGFLVDTTDWKVITRPKGLLAVLLIPVFFASLISIFGSLQGTNLPFQGQNLDQLQSTTRFILAFIATGASLAGIIYMFRGWASGQVLRLASAVFFILMALLTGRAAYRASFINYNYATEYLVYAHAAPGPKEVLKIVEEISRRTSGDKSIQVAYSSDALYPYWWYLRDYPNHRWYQNTPTRDLRDYPIVIAGEDVFNKIQPVLGDNFIEYDYIRLWWPNQDYYNLTWDRVWGVIKDPQMRAAVFNIWLNRDYTDYARLTSQVGPLSPETWSPAARMRLYIRRDIVSKIWEFGASPVELSPQAADPYVAKMIKLAPVQVIGATGSQPGQYQAPRGMTIAPDGSLYIADSRNHRIQHIAADGTVLQTWGTFADKAATDAPGGTFNEPWDVAVGKDGSVYVSDTWNHRIQKFTAEGKFVKMWGYFGQGEAPEAFWGPRGLAVDQEGRLYVMDTGNKRVVIFDPDGNFISQFGTSGFDPGQFDEPVGIAIDAQDNVYITDTWNQRIQVMAPNADKLTFLPVRNWEFTGWEGQSLDNKPFLAVSPVNGHVFVTDPEKPRIIEFDAEGNLVRGWGDYSSGPDGFGLVSGVAVDQKGDVWISDGGNNLILRFELPK
jgi:predicted membrane-bound mannosyltransferase/sugar lactone lactonase YvrE